MTAIRVRETTPIKIIGSPGATSASANVKTGPQGPAGQTGPAGPIGPQGSPGPGAAGGYANLARNPDVLIVGTVTRDANGAATSAPVVWPDGTPGTYTATTVSTAFPGAVDAYTITYGSPVTKTYTQPTVTRDANGAAVTVPAIVVS
jgi:hypothetical protein